MKDFGKFSENSATPWQHGPEGEVRDDPLRVVPDLQSQHSQCKIHLLLCKISFTPDDGLSMIFSERHFALIILTVTAYTAYSAILTFLLFKWCTAKLLKLLFNKQCSVVIEVILFRLRIHTTLTLWADMPEDACLPHTERNSCGWKCWFWLKDTPIQICIAKNHDKNHLKALH